MNTVEQNWDTHWKWEWFKNNGWDPPRFRDGYAGKSCKHYDQLLRKFGCRSVLDCSCGCGPKTIILAEMGYEVAGSDISSFAIEKANELSNRLGRALPFYRASWEELAGAIDRRFDCVLNDALAWTPTREELLAAARQVAEVLRDGGIVMFAAADEWNGRDPGNRERMHQAIAPTLKPYALEGPFTKDGIRMIQVIERRLDYDCVDVTNLYVVEECGSLRIEHDHLPELFRWTWEVFEEVFRSAGFRELHSHKTSVDGQERITNVAVK